MYIEDEIKAKFELSPGGYVLARLYLIRANQLEVFNQSTSSQDAYSLVMFANAHHAKEL